MPARTRRVLPLTLPSLVGALTAVLTLALLPGLAAPAAADEGSSPGGGALEIIEDTVEQTLGEAGRALDALAQVRDIFDDRKLRGQFAEGEPNEQSAAGEPAAEQSATLALRELALLKDELPEAQQPVAEDYLSRPTDGRNDQYGDGYTVPEEEPVCSAELCVHYVVNKDGRRNTRDAVDKTDQDPRNGVPDYVDLAVDTMTDVHKTYVGAGYRRPRSDRRAENNGGNALPDIYLADIGSDGLYGYCATDEDMGRARRAWGYCVLDNDYHRTEFPSRTVEQNLKVTAAHEYFHLVQFGYDIGEDAWIMESTATWAEDEVYGGIDDNVQYLREGPMANPDIPLDTFAGLYHYGSWAFFRFATETFPAEEGGMPTLVRDIWNRLDARRSAPDDYSLEGVKRVLAQRGMPLTETFARFSAASRTPGRTYEEARENRYPRAPLRGKARLSKRHPHAGQARIRVDHMSAATHRYIPRPSLRSSRWKLRLRLNLTQRWTRPAALVTVKPRGEAPRTMWVRLNRNGNARKTYAFSSRQVKWVELTVVNASDKFNCRRGAYSCQGEPRHDRRLFKFVGKAFLRR